MATIVLALYGLYIFFAFGMRVVLQLWRTGRTGVVGVGRGVGATAWISGAMFIGAVALGMAAPILTLLGRADPIPALDVAQLHGLGLGFFAAGLAVTLWAQLAMGDSWRVGVAHEEKTALVRGGPFRLVRNPIFSGLLLACLGLCLCVPSAVACIAWLALLGAIELQVRAVEEPYLLRAHGRDYGTYMASAGRFFPRRLTPRS
jgi:protein-S-isoprenylcysteine O-methyltransferase Ste14